MTDYYKNTRECIDRYNQIVHKIQTSPAETFNDEDEFLDNFHVYLAHALIKDAGPGTVSRDRLMKTMDVVLAAL